MPKSNNADDYLCNNVGPRTFKTQMKTMIMMINIPIKPDTCKKTTPATFGHRG